MFKPTTSFSSDGDEAEEVFLNLTPMIDVLTTLLFFLLISFGAVVIALINASVPVISEGEGDPNVSKEKVTLGLQITDKGFLLTASHDTMSEDELNRLKRTFLKVKGEYDYKGLHEYVYQVKRRYPKSSSIVITPAPAITYEVLVLAMDASRERPVTIKGRPLRIPLFPEAVVSTIVE